MPRKAQTQSLADESSAPGGAAAVDRAITLLAAFRSGDVALSLADLAERTRLYKSTVLRLLASLEHGRLVERLPNGHYALGMEVARLHAIHAANFSLDRLVLPVLKELVEKTGESAAYHVRQGRPPNQTRLCLYRVDSPHPIRDHIRAGDVLPLSSGTGGRVLSAFGLGDEQQVPSQEERVLYARIREQGYFASVGDRLAEVAGISAPVANVRGVVVAALTLTMPNHRYDELYVKDVLLAARQLGRSMG
ncbi:IclR family transcriptional regulator [Curvibacter sp. RS43]|uniref:IclR family transcriptional regulator n=1 Tax=Curvibacter microcysteis TaxID=3026419 RepID=UPI002362ABE2|nr:IclR family transcriptional regulator [Curvibacter sp. RS43]MDD0812846.1 IclR family transcriptional regulator [Curvibacter sp. RS43]